MLSINPHVARLVCTRTRDVLPADFSRPLALHQGNPLAIEYDLDAIDDHIGAGPGILRYAALLPVQGMAEAYAGDVGRTPVVHHLPLGRALGVSLHLKSEAGNPSGSFKDRGLAVGIALGIVCGAQRFCLPTQGNAGVAAALFSARAGLEGALVYMPEQHRRSSYARAARAFGADVRFAGSNIAEAGKAMRADLAPELLAGDIADISTFFEPGRLEGKKTLGLEIAEAFGAALPDAIVYPTGGGTGLLGIWKAFGELRGLDVLTGPLPRMIAVQSEACAPIVRAFAAGAEDVTEVTSTGTRAEGLDVPRTVAGPALLRVLRDSNGCAVAVSEEEIQAASRLLFGHGVATSLEGAATIAAVKKLRERDELAENARVLCLLTASHLVQS